MSTYYYNPASSNNFIPLPPGQGEDVYGPNTFDTTGANNTADVAIITAANNSKFPIYRIFFKGSNTPVDIMTQSVWSLCRHKGMRAGTGRETGYYQKAGHTTSLHFAGNRHPWNPLITPQNPVRDPVSTASQISNSVGSLAENYMPIENIAAVFHRTILEGNDIISSGSDGDEFSPQVIKSNVFRVNLKGGATFDVNAGGWVVTRQPTVRMIKPEGNFDTVENVVRPNKPLVYFYAYGGQHYIGDQHNSLTQASSYPGNTQSFNYNLRSGLAGPSVGHFTSGDSNYTGITIDGPLDGNYTTSITDPVKGDALSLDTGATYLPLENVLGITQLNSGDSSYSLTNPSNVNNSSLLEYQTYVRDAQNNDKPILNLALGKSEEGYNNVYQPAGANESIIVNQ